MKLLNAQYDGMESVEIKIISTTQQKYYLPHVPRLKGKIIKRIEVPYDVTTTPNNRTIFSSTNIKASFLTIITNKITEVYRIPFYFLYNFGVGYSQPKDIFDIKLYDTEKSYIEISDTANLSTDESILLNFYYVNERKQAQNRLLNSIIFKSIVEKEERLSIFPVQLEVTDTNKTKLYFPDDEFLRSKRIFHLRLYQNVNQLQAGLTLKTPDNKTLISDTVRKKSFLELTLKNGDRINNIPLSALIGEWFPQRDIYFNDLFIDWPNSSVNIANSTGLTANTIFYFLITYKIIRWY